MVKDMSGDRIEEFQHGVLMYFDVRKSAIDTFTTICVFESMLFPIHLVQGLYHLVFRRALAPASKMAGWDSIDDNATAASSSLTESL